VRRLTRAAVRLGRPVRGEIAVFYGHRRLPEPGEPVEGGMVKFQRLQSTFPNRPRDFNLLYLGSSSLPADEQSVIRLAKKRRAPIVLNQNGVAYPGWAGKRTEELNDLLRTVLRRADHVLYQSEFCKLAADRFLGEPDGGSEILHNAVDTAEFTPADEPPPGPPVLLLAGDQFQPYRLGTALRTLALLPDVRLLVTGTLIEDGHVLAEQLGVADRVLFTGRYAQRDAPAVYRRAHVLLHPKVNDPCPNVVVEALACGLPVVHSESGGTPELVGDAGVGIGSDTTWEQDVPPAPELLAAAIEHVLGELADYRGRARQQAERFDFEPWVERHRELFGELLGL
jgi:glycosyltransferase involved in cell wall biosynthesis